MGRALKLASRARGVRPFQVMELLARAKQLEATGRDIVHMEIGEPDFPTPGPVVAAAMEHARSGFVRYTAAAGLPPLREAIAQHYLSRHGVTVDPSRIFITPGASGALVLAVTLVLDPGERLLVTDPGYPCYTNIVRALGGDIVPVPIGPDSGFRLSVAGLLQAWVPGVAGALVASPSNPCGTTLKRSELSALVEAARSRGAGLICDEIYQGLDYREPSVSILELSHDVIAVNSFSKYFGMTGWRVGWLVVPESHIGVAERLAQNLFIAAPSIAQSAALSAFEPCVIEELERRRVVFGERRDFMLNQLAALGFRVAAVPDGAFYIYANCEAFETHSEVLARDLLERAGVAITPGTDFGDHRSAQHVRFAFTAPIERLRTGIERIGDWLERRA